MNTHVIAPFGSPGDSVVVYDRNGDWLPDPLPESRATGKVAPDVTFSMRLPEGPYWLVVNGRTIAVNHTKENPMTEKKTKEQKDAEKHVQMLRAANAETNERMTETPSDVLPEVQDNRPDDPEDQPNELPIGDNTGTTRQPTGQGTPQTGPIKRKK